MKSLSKIFIALLLLFAFPQASEAVLTPNKLYNNQTTGSNVNTWGIVLNSNFTTIDNNLGGTLSLSVAGSSNVTLTVNQAQNLIYNFTGVLTGNINVIFPAAGGLYFINNQTTGAFTLTIQAGTSTAGITIPQGQSAPIVVDNSTSPPTIDGAIGTTSTYTAASVGGTANAITIPTVTPPNFVLITGTVLWFVPITLNTSSTVTLTSPDGSIKNVKAISPGGLINIPANYLVPGNPQLMFYDGTEWVDITTVFFGTPSVVSTNQSVTSTTTFSSYIATASLTLTIAHVTTLPPFWFIDVDALGGNITITPNAADSININGATLSAGTSYVIPQGTSARMYTDATGNLYVLYNIVGNANKWTATQSVTPTSLAISTATFTPTFATSNTFQLTLVHASCPCTLANPSGTIVPGTDLIIEVKQSATGSDTITTYGSYYKFSGGTSPTLSTGANITDLIVCHVSDATHLFCGFNSNFAQ